MLRDNLVGLIEPMLNSAGAYSLALCTEWKPSSDDRPRCLENPRREAAERRRSTRVRFVLNQRVAVLFIPLP